jgi:hypothetical protein
MHLDCGGPQVLRATRNECAASARVTAGHLALSEAPRSSAPYRAGRHCPFVENPFGRLERSPPPLGEGSVVGRSPLLASQGLAGSWT